MSANWIEKAVGKSGSLHKQLGVPEGEKIPAKKMSKALKSSDPLEHKRAVLARTLSRFH